MFYRRHLPHWQRPDSALFITWRLHGSLPRRTLAASRNQSDLGKRFLLLDRELDRAVYGPTWLKDVRLAKVVVDALHHGAEHLQLYRLNAYVVMSNHVHILIWPKAELSKITKAIKGFTSRKANCLLGRTGQKFKPARNFMPGRFRIRTGQAGMPVLPRFVAALLSLLLLRIDFARALQRGRWSFNARRHRLGFWLRICGTLFSLRWRRQRHLFQLGFGADSW